MVTVHCTAGEEKGGDVVFYNNSSSGVPVLSKQDLESIADKLTRAFIRFDGKDDPRFSVWKFAAHFLGKQVSFEHLSNNAWILGLSVFVDDTLIPIYKPDTQDVEWRSVQANTIFLDKAMQTFMGYNVSKCRFTLMHESAHQLLHQNYYQRQDNKPKKQSVAYSVQRVQPSTRLVEAPNSAWSDVDWLEWQANYLAAALLMPKHRVNTALQDFDIYGNYQHKVNRRQYEPKAFEVLVCDVAKVFRVSDVTARIRLDALGFERLENQYVEPIDPYGPYGYLLNKPGITRQMSQEEAILTIWEDRYLDPDIERP